MALRLSVRVLRVAVPAMVLAAASARADPHADFARGLALDLGEGARQDSREAFTWYWRAAKAGLPEAEFNVGVMFDGGRGVPADLAQAALWYGRAAARGNARAAFNLAQLYAAGQGVPRNPAQAAAWFRAAAQGGITAAAGRGRLADEADPGARPEAPEALSARGGAQAELVWLAPAGGAAPLYLAAVYQVEDQGLRPIWQQRTEVSSVLVPLPGTGRPLVWRVYAVSPTTRHYAASPWATVPQTPEP